MSSGPNDLFEAIQLREWRGRLTAAVTILFLFEAITGLVIYFGPFNVTAQVMVLLHTALGLVFSVPYVVYQVHHWRTNRPRPFNQHKLLGYLSLTCVAVVGVSGLVLTLQAGWASRISYVWDMIHLMSGLAASAFVLWHLLVILGRHRWQAEGDKAGRMRAAQGVFVGRAVIGLVSLGLITATWAFWTSPPALERSFPEEYQLPFGENPFAPSLATTSTGGALVAETLGNSERCGTGNCHAEIVEEWLPSAHRFAAMSPFFQGVQGAMAANNGPESTRYCGGCHDPIALFSGMKNLYSDDLSGLGAQEGLSCVVCHSIESTDLRGNANYVIAPQPRYVFELSDQPAAAWLGRFLIRAYPRQHLASWTRDLYKTPEFCASCHKQFIDEEINNVGWVQLQNQYDNWRQSRWHVPDDPTRSITCRECHMRLVDSADPAAGDSGDYNRNPHDRKVRSHRFLAANQYLPTLLDLPGAEKQVALTEEWLRGELEVPEIADKWTSGPAVPIQIIAPETVSPGEEIRVQVVAVNNKPGHDFPTGPLDIIQAWIELEVRDQSGAVVFQSGALDEEGFLGPDATVFKAEAIDQFGNLIDKHNLWEMVGARFKRTLFPGYSDVATYAFFCPDQATGIREAEAQEEAPLGPEPVELARTPPQAMPPADLSLTAPTGSGELVISARLRYRKVDQYLINFLFPDQDMTSAITDVSVAEARIRVEGSAPNP